MGLWTTENQDQLTQELNKFCEASYRNYRSHSYAAGFLQSQLVQVLPRLPKRLQKELIKDFQRWTLQQEREAAARAADSVGV